MSASMKSNNYKNVVKGLRKLSLGIPNEERVRANKKYSFNFLEDIETNFESSNEQCTRRKKEESEYCGTHMKGTPHGIMDNQGEAKTNTQKVEVWAQDIQGIVYYIDKNNNVYQAEDIVGNKTNPKIIAKYLKVGEIYSIPEFNI